MNTANLDFKSATHCETFINQYTASLQSHLEQWDDSQLRAMIVWRICQPQPEQHLVALSLLRELWRRLEVRELENDN